MCGLSLPREAHRCQREDRAVQGFRKFGQPWWKREAGSSFLPLAEQEGFPRDAVSRRSENSCYWGPWTGAAGSRPRAGQGVQAACRPTCESKHRPLVAKMGIAVAFTNRPAGGAFWLPTLKSGAGKSRLQVAVHPRGSPTCFFLFCFVCLFLIYLTERSQAGREAGSERGGSRLSAEQRSQHGAGSQDPETTIQAKGRGLTH